MSWPVRALIGPLVWAVAFSVIYAAHGAGCAWGWPARPAPFGDLHRFTLISLWLVALLAAGAVLWRAPRGDDTARMLVRAGGWIGLVATALTLFPVLGLSSCQPGL